MQIRDFKECLTPTVLVASLGYFVDLFDITLFGVVRTASLHAIGVTDPAQVLSDGIFLYNTGMAGMMLGGLLWGILADKKGRLSVMFASILLYSVSNLANAFVWDVSSYAVCRFLCGVGLAGELGAAISLVAESLPKEKRGLGTTVVATLGMFGIVAAALIGQLLPWNVAYIVGGVMGLCLLTMRLRLLESDLFVESEKESVVRGNFFMLFSPQRFVKYIACILVGVPIYFTTGVLFTFAPELTASLQVVGTVSAGNAILFGSIGLTIGDFLSGILSQYLRSRKKVVAICLLGGGAAMLVYTLGHGFSSSTIYFLCLLIGLAVGYWAVLVTMAAEQFGTNLRGTVATTVPNFVRGSAVFVMLGFAQLKHSMTVPHAALLMGVICFGVALLAVSFMQETFAKDLNYFER